MITWTYIQGRHNQDKLKGSALSFLKSRGPGAWFVVAKNEKKTKIAVRGEQREHVKPRRAQLGADAVTVET